jgi:hypothetical protein
MSGKHFCEMYQVIMRQRKRFGAGVPVWHNKFGCFERLLQLLYSSVEMQHYSDAYRALCKPFSLSLSCMAMCMTYR